MMRVALVMLSLAVVVGGVWYLRPAEADSGLAAFSFDQSTSWKLPGIREVSGLAALSVTEVLLHDDEEAIVYRFDLVAEEVTRHLQLERQPLPGDFEGIAMLGGDLFLIESSGTLYQIPGGVRRTGVITDYSRTDLDLGGCEVEGLSHGHENVLLIACKRHKLFKDQIIVYQKPPDRDEASLVLRMPMALTGDIKKFRPSGISITDEGYLIVSAKDGLILETDTAGNLLRLAKLPKKRHKQPEGIAYIGDTLMIADESDKRRGRVTVYQAARSP